MKIKNDAIPLILVFVGWGFMFLWGISIFRYYIHIIRIEVLENSITEIAKDLVE